jgi:DNA-binding NarL/FixJ family response regulator
MARQKIRLVLADDHDLMREGLRSIIEDESDIEIVGLANDGETAINLTHQKRPDILILDIKMPGKSGLEVLWQIKREAPQVKVIILTMYDDEAFLQEAIRAGASGYFLKGSKSTELLTAIRKVFNGDLLLPKHSQLID